MHEPFVDHGGHEFPAVEAHVEPFNDVEGLAVEASQGVDVLAVAGGHGAQGAAGLVHGVHVDPLVLLDVEFLNAF